MKPVPSVIAGLLAACVLLHGSFTIAEAQTPAHPATDDTALSSAICPIVYPLDQSPSDRGFHYTFYGNGFFINSDGYLLTAAHVLSQLSDVQPYIVLRLPMAPPRLLKTTVIAIDRDHDVALLRATPNPFAGRYQVRYLPLAIDRPAPSQAVVAAALRPSRLRDPHTFDAFTEDRPSGEVLEYEFSQLEKGRGDTELFLFSHEVLLGDSGAPVVSADSQGVVGLVEGRWLRANAASLATAMKQPSGGVGAAVPIHYALPLLQQNGVTWHEKEPEEGKPLRSGEQGKDSQVPVPLSLVAAPYPSQALVGGEIVLDALVDRHGQLADIKVVRGAAPFLQNVLNAVQTWSFLPARVNGDAVEARIGIAFQFAPPAAFSASKPVPRSEETPADASDRGALPIAMTLPEASATSTGEASVILYAGIDAQGALSSVQVLRDAGSLGPPVVAAFRQWQFAPGKCDGANCNSALIAVIMPSHGSIPAHAQPNARTRTLAQ